MYEQQQNNTNSGDLRYAASGVSPTLRASPLLSSSFLYSPTVFGSRGLGRREGNQGNTACVSKPNCPTATRENNEDPQQRRARNVRFVWLAGTHRLPHARKAGARIVLTCSWLVLFLLLRFCAARGGAEQFVRVVR